jgi:hypothetical protein
MAEPYIVTTQIRTTGTFRSLAGALADTTAVCTVKAPDGTTTTPAVVHDSTGVYHADITLDQAGTWYIEWQGTVSVIAAGDAAINVRASYVDA